MTAYELADHLFLNSFDFFKRQYGMGEWNFGSEKSTKYLNCENHQKVQNHLYSTTHATTFISIDRLDKSWDVATRHTVLTLFLSAQKNISVFTTAKSPILTDA